RFGSSSAGSRQSFWKINLYNGVPGLVPTRGSNHAPPYRVSWMTCQPVWSMQSMRVLQSGGTEEQTAGVGLPGWVAGPANVMRASSSALQTAVKTLLRSADAWGAFTSRAPATSPTIFQLLFMCVTPFE